MDELARIRKRERRRDVLHRSFVNVCIGVTLITGVAIGYKVYEYFRYLRPYYRQQALLQQEELLKEGRYEENVD